MKLSGGVLAGVYPPAPVSAFAERAAALVVIAVLSPLLIALGVGVAVVSRRAPLVAHRRSGYLGQPFWMIKFRSMWDRREPASRRPPLIEYLPCAYVPEDKMVPDLRVTHPLGRWMRRFSLDELPQLVHVATGEMSFVGPRPITAEELATHYGPAAVEVLSLKPGITGLWQVMGRSSLSYRQRRRLDVFLVRKRSRALAFWIAVRTIPAVVMGENAR